MHQSILVTGGSVKTRNRNALELAQKNSSKFDIIQIETSSEKGIAKIREVNSLLYRKPFESKILTLILFEADNLTPEAQNALLKMLEEPPLTSQIILTAGSAENLLPTVVSRCLEIRLDSTRDEKKGNLRIPHDSFAELVEKLEKGNLEASLESLEDSLRKGVREQTSPEKLKKIHKTSKILLRLTKASKANANKKLLALIASLELDEFQESKD